MALARRPKVAVYEENDEGEEMLVHRPMNDEEFADLKERQKNAPDYDNMPHPLLAQVGDMSDEDKQKLRELLNG